MMTREDFKHLAESQRKYFESNATRSYSSRIDALRRFRDALQSNEKAILRALKEDLGKPELEAYSSEIGLVYTEINHAIKNLHRWMKPSNAPTPLLFFHSKSWIDYEPRGVVLIIGAWNYPCQLVFEPLVGAVAAGCCAIAKPSELAPASSAVVEKVLSEAFDERMVKTVQGPGVEVVPIMMESFRFDYVFYTGGAVVGQRIAEMAAKNLVPVTLELGGKSPCLVDGTADLDTASKRIVWGKFWNAGQSCVAPDYILVDNRIKDQFIHKLIRVIEHEFDVSQGKDRDLATIIDQRHFERLTGLLQGVKILCGGQSDNTSRRIEPTLVDLSDLDHPLMKDEIFGPILPVVGYDKLETAIEIVKRFPSPLSLYLFTEDPDYEMTVLQSLRFGNGCVNNTVVQFAHPHLPFGGIGLSGYGAAHGRFSFETFSHRRGMMKTFTWVDMPVKYRPYRKGLKWFRWLMRA